MRLAKRMAVLGMCSRREADALILKGWVKVNGIVATEKGQKVTEHDVITLNQQAQQHQANRWTYLGSGLKHPRFLDVIEQIAPARRAEFEAAAPVFS